MKLRQLDTISGMASGWSKSVPHRTSGPTGWSRYSNEVTMPTAGRSSQTTSNRPSQTASIVSNGRKPVSTSTCERPASTSLSHLRRGPCGSAPGAIRARSPSRGHLDDPVGKRLPPGVQMDELPIFDELGFPRATRGGVTESLAWHSSACHGSTDAAPRSCSALEPMPNTSPPKIGLLVTATASYRTCSIGYEAGTSATRVQSQTVVSCGGAFRHLHGLYVP